MKTKLLILGALLALQCATTQAQIPITSSASAPATGAYDQYYLPGPVSEATNTMNISGNGTNPDSANNDGLTYVASDRTSKGQSFTTGSNPNGYTLSSVTVRHILMSSYLNNGTWAQFNNGNSVAFRFGTISGSTLTPTLTTTATYSGTSFSANGTVGTGTYLTFDLSGAGIATLSSNTTYFFELASSGPWFELHNTRTNATSYKGGTAFAGNNNGALDSDLSVSLSHGEFAFVAKLAAVGAPSVVATVDPASGSAGQAFTVTATVTPGVGTVTNVSVDLSAIGGSAAANLVLSDVANIYTNTFTVSSGAPLGAANLTVTVKDTTPLTGSAVVLFTVLPSDRVWDGGSLVDSKWSSRTNWQSDLALSLSGNNVFFAGTTRLTPDMDNNYSVSALVFSNTAGSFIIGSSTGGTLTVGSGGITNNSASAQTLNVPIVLGAAQTFNAAAGSLTLNSNVTGGAAITLLGTNTFSGTGTSTISDLLVNGGQMSVTAGTVNVTDTSGDLTKIDNGATVVVSGGALNIGGTTGWFPIGNTADTTNTLIVSGGTVNVTNGYGTEVGRIGAGVLTINSGSFLSWDFNNINGFVVGDQSTSSGGTVNLNGGTLSFNYLVCNNGNNNFYFNGGTLKPTISRTTFWNNSIQMSAQVRNGGASVDTAGLNITIGQALLHSAVDGDNATDGGLTKTGNGTLTLSGGYSYTGPTKVLGGTFNLNLAAGVPGTGGDLVVSNATLVLDASSGAVLPAANVTLKNGATLHVTNYPYANAISGTGNLTMSGGTTINLNYGTLSGPPTAAAINVAGSFSASGVNVINITGSGLVTGQQFPLIDYTGTPVPTNAFRLASLPPGVNAVLTNNAANSSLDLLVGLAGNALSWHGANADNSVLLTTWDINTSGNWYDVNNNPVTYLQYNGNTVGDNVTFGDNGYNLDGTNSVNLPGRVVPSTVTINNTTPYRLAGTGGIDGSTAVVKNNTGSFELGTSNNYTGGTFVNAGTLAIDSGSALGVSSTLLTLGGDSTLQVAGNMANPRATTLNGTANVSTGVGSATVNTLTNVASQLQLNPSSGAGLIVNGEGTLLLSGTNDFAYFYDGGAVGGNLLITNGSFVISQNKGDSKFDQGGNVTIANGGVLAVRSANDAWFPIGDTAGTTSTMTIAGGTFIVTNLWGLQLARNGDAVLTLNSGNLIVNDQGGANLGMSLSEGGGNSTFNLNGGRATLLKLRSGGGVETVNLNGGTLAGTASRGDYFSYSANLTANVRNGGVVVDTAGFDLAIGQPLLHSTIPGDNATDGGLTKTGNGTLTLTGTNTYTGPTVVNAGALAGNGTIAGALTNNATLTPGNGGATDTLTVTGNITLNAGSTNTFSVDGSSHTNTSVIAGGNVTYGGLLNIVTAGTFTTGQQFQLFSGAGAANASSFAGIAGSPGSGLAFSFTNGVLSVVSSGPGTFTSTPGITSFTLNGANVVISGTNGQAGDAYYLLGSTNLALPLSQWTTVATNVLGADGAFTFTGTNVVVPGNPQQFYILSNTNSNH